MRKVFYSSRSSPSKMLHTRNFMRTQTRKTLDATLDSSVMILSILYRPTADAENNIDVHGLLHHCYTNETQI